MMSETVAGSGSGADAMAGAPSLIITIDGPAGTGKSSVARRLADRLGLEHLDTGAMYRAAALLAAERGIDPVDGPAIASVIESVGIRFDWAPVPPRLLLGGDDVGDRIRSPEVSRIVSQVAARPEVRTILSAWQRRIAQAHPRLVTEGRDQGSSVFPDADVRFYLDADPTVRASRRALQLEELGRPMPIAEVQADIEQRDALDRSRTDAPLRRPEGAVDVDTSHRTLDEVLDLMEAEVRRVIAARGADGP